MRWRKFWAIKFRRQGLLTLLAVGLSLIVFGNHSFKVSATHAGQKSDKLMVKAVVVTMFETGEDTGDAPGEFQTWVEREQLDRVYKLPAAYHNALVNDKGLLGIVTGIGTAKSATTIMALGSDPRFDLTKAYWLVAGIAGIDPNDGSLGSAAWAKWVVDADLSHEIDAREIPSDWPYGYLPLFTRAPNSTPIENIGEAYQLNTNLADWAYQLTKDVELDDSPGMAAYRTIYTDYPNAQKPPFVLMGDNLSGGTFWHGKLLNQWANDWVKLWSNDEGNYVTTAMEDTGTLQALTNLAKAGKVDLNRVMVLRTASNYDSQGTDQTAAESLNHETGENSYSGFLPSLEAAYRVGSTVIHNILDNWETYEHKIPEVDSLPDDSQQ